MPLLPRQNAVGCQRVYVEENSELIGFESYDLCDKA